MSYAQTEWENTFGLPDSSFALDMIQAQDGDFVLYGGTNAFTDSSDAFLLKFNSAGNLVWLRDLGFHVYPYEGTLIEANNGDLIVCGEKIMRCNDLGNEIWTLDQASVDIDEAENGELFSVNYDKVYKVSSSGILLEEELVGVSIESFEDSILNCPSTNIVDYRIYAHIALIDSSRISIGGISINMVQNECTWNQSVQILNSDSLSALEIIDQSVFPLNNTCLADFEPFRLNNNFVISSLQLSNLLVFENDDNIEVKYYQNSWNTAYQEVLSFKLFLNGSNESNWSVTCIPVFPCEDEIFYKLRHLQKSENPNYLNGFTNAFINCVDYIESSDNYYFEIEQNECHFFEQPVIIGDAGLLDYISNSLKSDSNEIFLAGTIDLDSDSISLFSSNWEFINESKFMVAKLMPFNTNVCLPEEFEEIPVGLSEDQTTNTTRLKWNHYSDKADACLLNGGTISSLDINASFTQIPGTLLVQGNNIEGDLDGYDFSPAFTPNANFTLFNPTLFPSGVSAELIPGAFYKWKVRCGCLVDPTLPLPQRLQGSNVVLSPWSEWDVFENLD